ncbi:MAG: hypothetical protein ABSH35_32745 [Isosphaeraceae bacterium]
MAIGNPIRPHGHFADLSDQGDRDALENRNFGGRPPEKCDKASAFLTEKLTQRDCKACDLINEWVAQGGAKGTVFNEPEDVALLGLCDRRGRRRAGQEGQQVRLPDRRQVPG